LATTLEPQHPIPAAQGSVYGALQVRLRWIAAAEVAAMTMLILSYIWLWQRSFPGAFWLCVAGYFGIGILGHLRRGESLQHIGLRLDNWLPAIRNASIVVLVTVSGALIVGRILDSWHFPSWKTALWTLPVAIVWATAQQYGLLCVFYRRLHDALGSVMGAMVGAALMFAIFHLPNSFLMTVTLFAGMIACVLYRYQPNILVIGVAHALISFTLYFALPPDVTAQLRVGPGYYSRSIAAHDILPRTQQREGRHAQHARD
jgi:membrane protease YdiL (CAAX protease family)